MKGDPDISKDVYIQVAANVYFDVIKYEEYKRKRISYKDLITAINNMGRHVLSQYLVGPDESKISSYINKRGGCNSQQQSESNPAVSGSPQEDLAKVPGCTSKTHLRNGISIKLIGLGLDAPSFVFRIIPGGPNDNNRLSDAALSILSDKKTELLQRTKRGVDFIPYPGVYRELSQGTYLDVVGIVKAFRGHEETGADLTPFAEIDISQFIFTEEQIKELAQKVDDPTEIPDEKVDVSSKPPVASARRGRAPTKRSALRERLKEKLSKFGNFPPSLFLKIIPASKADIIRIKDERLANMGIEQRFLWKSLVDGKEFKPSHLIYYPLNDNKYLDMPKIIKAHRGIDDNEDYVDTAGAHDISEFIFSLAEIKELASKQSYDDLPAEVKPIKKASTGRSTPLSKLRKRREQELLQIGMDKNFVLRFIPLTKKAGSHLVNKKLGDLKETQKDFFYSLCRGGAFFPPSKIYQKLEDEKYLDVVNIVTVQQRVNEIGESGLSAIDEASKFDISSFVFTKEQIMERASELFPEMEKTQTPIVKKDEETLPQVKEQSDVFEKVTLKCFPSDSDYNTLIAIISKDYSDFALESEKSDEKRYIKFSGRLNQEDIKTIQSIFLACQGHRVLEIE